MAPSKENLRFAIISTDVVLFTIRDDSLNVLLIPVDKPPHFIKSQGFPGGLIHPKETGEQAAKRLIAEKGGISKNVYIEQLATFSKVDRDPRGRVVAVAYMGLVNVHNASIKEGSVSQWTPIRKIKTLAYDHNEILDYAVERLRSRIEYTNIVSGLMPEEFTLSELQSVYELILNRSLDKRNFRKKILGLKILKSTGRMKKGGASRPAELYSFKETKVKEIEML
jgi:8-oxo-dGTP diphosphatase